MDDYEVIKSDYDELPQKIKDEEEEHYLSNNGCGKEYATYLIIKRKGDILSVRSDAMEPEDAVFYRDLSWIREELLRAYEIGKAVGRKEIKK